ncbi:hypothetical protein OUZ56_008637 [Daphnia magna]|uniref:Uncharacterized protein n=1 Tax=Daphnia magna TaxID=35525 RepID=A0ABR0ADU9_9CRUS|nr:hypothetical protein OUZ56_008637 [Daphnia magna]
MMRMFMALILNFIRPFNTHDHYANERIMRLQTEGAFQTLQRQPVKLRLSSDRFGSMVTQQHR